MDTITVVIIIAVIVLAALAIAAAMVWQRRRSQHLRQQFGPEYRRTLEESKDRRSAERALHDREKRRSRFEVTPLPERSAEGYRREWDRLQQGFVDEPGDAVVAADRLVLRMMRESGYPMDDFDRRVEDISVDHPAVAENYRQAHRVAVAQADGNADTEQLRQAVTAYHRLVDALLSDRAETTETKEQS